MGSTSCYCLFLILILFFHSSFIYNVAADNATVGLKRESPDTIIGGSSDGYGPAPPPDYPTSPEIKECVTPLTTQPPSCLPANIVRDFKSIQQFKNQITYDPLEVTKSWNQDNFNICTYKGFTCAHRPDSGVLSVAATDFNGYNFNGPNLEIKDFIDKLKDLTIFHANSNNFTGIVPNDISIQNINFLYEFDISNNKYTGGFPFPLLSARNLTFLDIRFNQFSGPIPREVFMLDLDALFLNNNQFNQQLPDNVGNTSALYLTFANNNLGGPIPSSIGNAKNLLEVLFLKNQFTGCLPYEIGNLKKATVFDVSCNMLTGPIPHSFACLAKIQILNLANNGFYGPVPEMVCQLPNLQNLSLSGNFFTQVGPECRKLIMLKRIDVGQNCILDLPYQRSADECKEFFSKRRTCPNEKSLTYVPCRKNWHRNSTVPEQSTIAVPPSPRSYEALSPNNKFRF
ncbi:hypothetical protein JCGZ_22116 [Jatropha curcas]|uniref:Cell wall hydroxyproline-rich glycoprotein n=1 Tax=Jatropha curcas TaxID=180498 RepID=A0A067LQA5_JATCU|nr:uncharacterized protein At4g06744 [Jatropha curcas]KDP47120.1 hypothetical protein JCGZ_22116 [Jatropha curcas]